MKKCNDKPKSRTNRERQNWQYVDSGGMGTDGRITDYALFVDKKPVGIIEAKREEAGEQLTAHEEQSKDYAASKLKYLNNDPLPFVYESTGALTRFTDYRDPKPRSRPVFHFHRPETQSKVKFQSIRAETPK